MLVYSFHVPFTPVDSRLGIILALSLIVLAFLIIIQERYENVAKFLTQMPELPKLWIHLYFIIVTQQWS